MSYTLQKRSRILGRAQTLRRDLMAFVIPVTIWAALLNVFSNSLFAWTAFRLGRWAAANMPLAFLAGAAALTLLAYGGMLLLAGGWSGGMEETLRFKVMMPIECSAAAVKPIPLQGYHVPGAVAKSLATADAPALGAAYARLNGESPGRPFRGELHSALVRALADQMAQTLVSAGSFLLSKNAEYHGVDFGNLGGSSGVFEPTALEGTSKRIDLPARCRASVEFAPADRYGKTGAQLKIEGPFGDLQFTIKPQWAHLIGPDGYHGRTYSLVMKLLGEKGSGDIWIVELPAEVRVRLRNRKLPWFFLSSRFEMYADWLDETVRCIEEFWNWEEFMERAS